MAELEAAAVTAFEHLGSELEAHGLSSFAQHALGAALDEVEHANRMTRLALGFGIAPRRQTFMSVPVRSLEEVAIDNGGEGCGRELLGALINRHQAAHASDPRVRATMGSIAEEESEHARLSVALAETLMPRLTSAQRRRVREAQEQTLTLMAREELPNAAARELGLMDEGQLRATTRSLLDRARI